MILDLPAVLRQRLRAAADPGRAAGQRAYMKSEMPFLGVRVPEVRRLALTAAREVHEPDSVRAAALELWDGATHREERYAATALLRHRSLRGDLAGNVALVEHMVRTGRWWDFTDELAGRIAEFLDAQPDATAQLVRGWSTDADLWIRRIAVLSQLGRGARTDPELLADVIEPNREDPEFFIRKAIGWALREYARTDPGWVRSHVATHALSPLSEREALRHL